MNKDRFTPKELALINDMIETTINDTNDTISFESVTRKIRIHNSYVKAFDIFMEYWDSLPDEEKPKIDKRLERLKL